MDQLLKSIQLMFKYMNTELQEEEKLLWTYGECGPMLDPMTSPWFEKS